MTTSTGTDPNPKGDGSTQAVVPPADGSQGDGSKASGDDVVPKTQFLAALKSATEKAAAADARARDLEAQLQRMQQAAAQPKPPTLAELRKHVEAGDLTQDQADALWEKQIADRIERKAAEAVAQGTKLTERSSKITAELNGYKELVPEVWMEGTPERAKVEKEFKHLVDLGNPANEATEAAALRVAYGDLSTLRASKSARTGPAESHSEAGGGRPPADGGGKQIPLKSLTAAQKDYYEKGIASGRYKGWEDVKQELEYSSPRTRG